MADLAPPVGPSITSLPALVILDPKKPVSVRPIQPHGSARRVVDSFEIDTPPFSPSRRSRSRGHTPSPRGRGVKPKKPASPKGQPVQPTLPILTGQPVELPPVVEFAIANVEAQAEAKHQLIVTTRETALLAQLNAAQQIISSAHRAASVAQHELSEQNAATIRAEAIANENHVGNLRS